MRTLARPTAAISERVELPALQTTSEEFAYISRHLINEFFHAGIDAGLGIPFTYSLEVPLSRLMNDPDFPIRSFRRGSASSTSVLIPTAPGFLQK